MAAAVATADVYDFLIDVVPRPESNAAAAAAPEEDPDEAPPSVDSLEAPAVAVAAVDAATAAGGAAAAALGARAGEPAAPAEYQQADFHRMMAARMYACAQMQARPEDDDGDA